jgi:hypothetical protein
LVDPLLVVYRLRRLAAITVRNALPKRPRVAIFRALRRTSITGGAAGSRSDRQGNTNNDGLSQ